MRYGKSARATIPASGRSRNVGPETFSELAREYIERHASKKRSGREDIRLLNSSPYKKKTGKKPHVPLVTRWGDRRIKDIKRRDIRELLDEVAARAPIMANRTLALVRKMFNFAIERDWLETNPCHMVKPPGEEKQRERVLSERKSDWSGRRSTVKSPSSPRSSGSAS